MKDKNIDIENRIAKAKTTDELLALAAEIGEPLTLEQAEKLLAEIRTESQTAEQSFASEEDIPDAELEAVAGEAVSLQGQRIHIFLSIPIAMAAMCSSFLAVLTFAANIGLVT